MKTRYRVGDDGVVVATVLPDPDFKGLDTALADVATPVPGDDLVDSAGHRIGNYL